VAAKSTKKTKKTPRLKKKTDVASGLLENQWPKRHDVFFRPDRYNYVKRLLPKVGCVFCNTLEGVNQDGPNLLIHKELHAMVILNKYPYNSAHVMVLPTKHVGDMAHLSLDEQTAIHRLLLRTIDIVKKEFTPDGMNVGINLGAVAGAGIPDHLHWHIVPRWFGDSNFMPLIANVKPIPQTLEQVAARYRAAFAKDLEW
jgi:ATP adenylyltransferase